MAGLDYFQKYLIRIASQRGREVLEDILFGNFELLKQSGGKQMVSTSAGGKSFTFQVPASLSIDLLMGRVEHALEAFDSMTDAQRTALLSTPHITRTVADFS